MKRALLILGLGLGGCESSTQPASPSAAQQQDNGGVRLALLQPSGASNAAEVAGNLHVEGACLYISQGPGRKTLPAFTIPDIRWDSHQNALLVGQSRYRAGERVLLSGAPPFEGQKLDWMQPPDASCDVSSIVIVGSVTREAAAGPS